ncbi:MAG: hypothetical protein V3W19_09785, partial [Desulfatiglandales bacterium]
HMKVKKQCYVCKAPLRRRVFLDIMFHPVYEYFGFAEGIKKLFKRHTICKACRDSLYEATREIGEIFRGLLIRKLDDAYSLWISGKNPQEWNQSQNRMRLEIHEKENPK